MAGRELKRACLSTFQSNIHRDMNCMSPYHSAGFCTQARARGDVRDSDNSVAAHLLRIRDPKTGQELSDKLLAGEFGMFFTAGEGLQLLLIMPGCPTCTNVSVSLHCWLRQATQNTAVLLLGWTAISFGSGQNIKPAGLIPG